MKDRKMNQIEALKARMARRTFMGQGMAGMGSLAMASMLNATANAAPKPAKWTGVVKPLHFKQKIKTVIHLCMAGGSTHLETLDWKPKLAELNGKPMPVEFTKGKQIAQLQGKKLKALGPQATFKQHGKSGQWISDALPHIAGVADELCVINSMRTFQINHDPAHSVMNTGSASPGRPSMGSWVLYGLGAETDQLPGYVVLVSVGGGQSQPIASRQWHSGYLPSIFQGVQFYAKGNPVHYAKNPAGVSKIQQRRLIDAVSKLNRIEDKKVSDPEIATRIAQYEMAFRMQASVPELMDVSKESKKTLEMYGAKPGDGSFASNCLLARRLVERGVRFIQLYHRGWDHHGGIKNGVKQTGKYVDQGTAALIKDLKQRGMLDETLIIWGGEFGRTPMAQGSGRDHHIAGFSSFMCGGGIKPGMRYGSTDELGYEAVEDIVHVRDLHATIMALLGIDHRKLSVKFQGLDQRLTGVEEAHILKKIMT
jgi:hypothetical protein